MLNPARKKETNKSTKKETSTKNTNHVLLTKRYRSSVWNLHQALGILLQKLWTKLALTGGFLISIHQLKLVWSILCYNHLYLVFGEILYFRFKWKMKDNVPRKMNKNKHSDTQHTYKTHTDTHTAHTHTHTHTHTHSHIHTNTVSYIHMLAFLYFFTLAFTTSSVLAFRRTSFLWSSPLSFSVTMRNP